jgi:Asp-tRNA(Asn)/Glu-tRNA(Gln) amidotransferase A subunit family amidase
VNKADTVFRGNSISDIHQRFGDGSLDPVAVAEYCIDCVDRLDTEFHAWVCFDSNALIRGAMTVRESLVRKTPMRALEGIPIGIKDIFNTTDLPTQMGSELWLDFTPGNDARVVYYLKNSGGLIAGKTITAEFAVHALNETLNPHDIELTPGTSSSGSAVSVALGMVPVAIGTQTAGSIIRPASFCGVYGFKPSFGLIPRTGSLKTTDSLDSIGFFVSHPTDMFRVLESIRVHGPNFPVSYKALNDYSRQNKPKNRPWKVGLAKTHTWPFSLDYAKESLLSLTKKLSAGKDIEVEEVELPGTMNQAHQVHSTIYEKSLAYYFKNEYESRTKISMIMQEMIDRGKNIPLDVFYSSLQHQNRIVAEMDAFMKDFDVLICLSTAGAAPSRNEPEIPDSALMWTLAHLPAVSAPAFSSPNGLPFGVQILARKYNDHLLLAFVQHIFNLGFLPNQPNPRVKFASGM